MRRAFSRLDQALLAAIERLQLEPMLREGRALAIWTDVVGPQIAAATHAEDVRDGVLSVLVRSSTWAFELTFQKEKILRSLNARLGRGTLKDVRFRVGVPEAEEATPPLEPIPSAAELANLPLSAEEEALIAANTIGEGDPELRERIARALATEQRRNHWLAEHGYHRCPRCGTLYRQAGPECPACRREQGQT